jgi:hypothetical protein
VTGRQADLEALIEEITVDCYGEEEELTGFLTYLEDALERPVEATVVGVPVIIVGVDCPAARCVGLWPGAGGTAPTTRCRCSTWCCRAAPSWRGSSPPTVLGGRGALAGEGYSTAWSRWRGGGSPVSSRQRAAR